MSDIDVHHLAAAYTLDALEAREREVFEAHYEGCDVCRTDVMAFRDTMATVAASLAVRPPASVKDRVMAEIAVTRQLSPTTIVPAPVAQLRRRPAVSVMLAAAAAVVLLVLGVVALTGRDTSTSFADELASVLDQPDARMIDLPGKDGTPGTFKVAWSPSMKKAALIGENLPAAPSGKAYEVWLVTPEQTMAMDVLDPAEGGQVHRVFDAPQQPTAWAITMEPEQGVAVATGDIMYLAEV